jgi:preprotein translocase subunit SecD
MKKTVGVFFLIIILTIVAGLIALPSRLPINFNVFGRTIDTVIGSPVLDFNFLGRPVHLEYSLKQGLDIQGGMQVILGADVSAIPEADRQTALEAAREVIARRVDLYGITEPSIQTSQFGSDYRLIVELPGVDNPQQALELVGTTAQLDFRLETPDTNTATESAITFFNSFQMTGLTGQQLERASVQFDPNTGEPIIALAFNEDGRTAFSQITTDNVGKRLAIFIDGIPVMTPVINTPITDGQAVIAGAFTLDQAKQLTIQLNAGALPIPITVLEQRTIGASLGQQSVAQSVRAGIVGILLVMAFMIMLYGVKGFLADIALVIYAVITIALYKVLGVTLSLPGIAGMLLAIGMAVDSNILIFERMKEELRVGRPSKQAMELGFGRAWDSIKDANLATIFTALILINPLNFSFLNTSGLVRGFGVTLLIGVLVSLFTGIVVTRTLMRLFLPHHETKKKVSHA